MKQKLNHIIVLLILCCSFTVNANNTKLLEEARSSYDKADYSAAIKNYESIVASGEVSYEVFYNLGNAYYKNNEIGKAIYNYQMAHKLNPSDEDIKHNLTIANKHTVDQIEVKENYFAKNIESGLLHTLSTNGWAWLTIISLFVGVLFFILFIISSKWKRLFFWSGSLSVIICILSFFIGSAALSEITSHKNAIVLTKEASAFNSPTADAKEQFKVHEGTKVNILESNNNWTSVQLDNGNEGWIKTKELGLY